MSRTSVFAPVITAGLLVALAGYVVVHAGLAATRFLPSLNDPWPPLSRVDPVAGTAPPRMAERVVIVLIDGLRLRESYGAPLLDAMRARGVDAEASAHYPTWSRPNHTTVVTGVPPQWSGVRTNHYAASVRVDSIMDRAAEAGLRSAFAADDDKGLPTLFTRAHNVAARGLDIRFRSAFYSSHYTPWPGGFTQAGRRLIDDDYQLVVLLPGAIDRTGHELGGASAPYRAAVQIVDDQLREALAGLDLERDALIITSDHGHSDPGGHGGVEPEVVRVPLILAGAGIRAGALVEGAALQDVAPTAAALLGLPAPGHALGRTLTEALLVDDQTRARIERADQVRILRNETVAEAALESAAVERARRRIVRAAVVTGLLMLGVLALVVIRRAGGVHADWRVLLIALPAFPLAYYGVLGLFGQQFSPSMVPDVGDIERALFGFGLISTAVHVLAAWVALRGRVVLRDRLAAANALTVCGLFMALIPAGLVWAIFTRPHVALPSPAWLVLAPATYVAVACYALAAAVTLVLEIVIFFARAVDPRVRLRRLEHAAARERARLAREAAGDAGAAGEADVAGD